MSFVSLQFFIFFAVVVTLYFRLPEKLRIPLLLVASYVFYAYWKLSYLSLIVFSTLVDYIVARLMKRHTGRAALRKVFLGISLVTNLGVLFTFKYFNFFSSSLERVSGIPLLHLSFLLPVGISFYTFQSMAYSIDVYRGKIEPEQSFARFATFIAFFPQLVAGPIERAQNMLPQFRHLRDFNYENAVTGLRRMLWGAFKKVVIAGLLSIYVDNVYGNSTSYSGAPLILATVFFAFQIYCDFSGYSDIAIGAARILGFDLIENFRQPYFSRSIREFWRRWHISLSTWFKDYLYIPLGGNRNGKARQSLNLFIVFVVSGLWHGANYTFAIWGFIHGIIIVLEVLFPLQPEKRFPTLSQNLQYVMNIFRTGATFSVVCFAWIFFRANSWRDALYISTHLFSASPDTISNVFSPILTGNSVLSSQSPVLMLSLFFIMICLLLLMDWQHYTAGSQELEFHKNPVLRWGVYYLQVITILLVGIIARTSAEFIYFQF